MVEIIAKQHDGILFSTDPDIYAAGGAIREHSEQLLMSLIKVAYRDCVPGDVITRLRDTGETVRTCVEQLAVQRLVDEQLSADAGKPQLIRWHEQPGILSARWVPTGNVPRFLAGLVEDGHDVRSMFDAQVSEDNGVTWHTYMVNLTAADALMMADHARDNAGVISPAAWQYRLIVAD